MAYNFSMQTYETSFAAGGKPNRNGRLGRMSRRRLKIWLARKLSEAWDAARVAS
jgi:hypothetical protein